MHDLDDEDYALNQDRPYTWCNVDSYKTLGLEARRLATQEKHLGTVPAPSREEGRPAEGEAGAPGAPRGGGLSAAQKRLFQQTRLRGALASLVRAAEVGEVE